MKLKMLKTVFDGKTYHKAGEIVDVNKDIERHYLHKGFAQVIEAEIENNEEAEIIVEEIETKEEKKVYKKRK